MVENERKVCEREGECGGEDKLCFELKAKILRNNWNEGKQQTETKKYGWQFAVIEDESVLDGI